MVEVGQLPHGPEHFDPEHQYDEQRPQLHVAAADADSAHGKGQRGPGGHEEDRRTSGGAIGGDHTHGALVEVVSALRQGPSATLALPKRLERGQPLDAVQEVGTQVAVGLAAPVAAVPVPPIEHGGNDQRKEGEQQED